VTILAPTSLGVFSESIPIDFSVNVVTPFYNAALLKDCGQLDSRAKDLILIVRRWTKDRGICHAAKGHLSPYIWSLLAIYFLQVGAGEEGAVLPPLQYFETVSKLLGGSAGKQKWRAAEVAKIKETKSAAVLFKDFIHFFHMEFDWRNESVSISAGRREPPRSDASAKEAVTPNIEDPFCKTDNLADGMTDASLTRLKEELARAESLCVEGASLSELLEPWAPPELAEKCEDKEQCDVLMEVVKEPEVSRRGRDWRQDAIAAQSQASKAGATPPWRRAK
jgi:DNA polymerase sigma